jgi:type II secretory pathway component PulM
VAAVAGDRQWRPAGEWRWSPMTAWDLALLIGLVAALVVAVLLLMLIRAVRDIEHSVDGLLAVAGEVANNTSNIPQLEATAPVLAQIVDEAVVQDGYMNALTDGYGGVPA